MNLMIGVMLMTIVTLMIDHRDTDGNGNEQGDFQDQPQACRAKVDHHDDHRDLDDPEILNFILMILVICDLEDHYEPDDPDDHDSVVDGDHHQVQQLAREKVF